MNDTLRLISPATRESWEIPVRFEDEHLLALDKPSGLLISPDRYDFKRPNLMRLLHQDMDRDAAWVRERQLTYLANAHRLDFDTTGILLLAKSKPVLIALADQFGAEKTQKRYLALAHGSPPDGAFATEAKLGPHPFRRGWMRVDHKQGKRTATRFLVAERFNGYCLIQCELLTDRTHQIRVHLQHLGFPLAGDTMYGGCPLLLSQLKSLYRLKPGKEERPLMGRVALHAESLCLIHPMRGTPLSISAPLPKDLTVALKYLRKFAGHSVT